MPPTTTRRVLRSRDSRGLAASQSYRLFPSARQELGLDGEGIVIAILDTGVNDAQDSVNVTYPGHESLRGKFLGGGEFATGIAELSTPLNGSANPSDHGAAATEYHATHVAGTAMGTGGESGFFAGVAPKARLVDCKVLTDAGATNGGDAVGLDWVIANRHRMWSGLAGAAHRVPRDRHRQHVARLPRLHVGRHRPRRAAGRRGGGRGPRGGDRDRQRRQRAGHRGAGRSGQSIAVGATSHALARSRRRHGDVVLERGPARGQRRRQLTRTR